MQYKLVEEESWARSKRLKKKEKENSEGTEEKPTERAKARARNETARNES